MLFWVSFSVYWRPLVSKTPACSKQQWANELNAVFTGPLERLEVSSLWVVLACVLWSSLQAVLSLHLALWFWVSASSFQDCWGSGARVSCAFGGGPWHLGGAGWCPTWPSGLFAVPWRLRCSRPFSLGALTTSVGRGCACWFILDLRGDFRHWCRLSLFLRKNRDIWSSWLCGQCYWYKASGLYSVCVPVIWTSLIGVELFMQHKLLH